MASSTPKPNMAQLLSTELGVDYEIRVPGYVFEVHSAVLIAHSTFFEEKINSDKLTDPSKHHIVLDEDPHPVFRMIQALYTVEYFEKMPEAGLIWADIMEKSRIPAQKDEEGHDNEEDGDQNDTVSMVDSFYSEYSPKYIFLRAAIYALAERHSIPALTKLSIRNFTRETSTEEYVDKLLSTLEFLYLDDLDDQQQPGSEAPAGLRKPPRRTLGEDLRRIAVWLAQSPDFATRFARESYFMCFGCEATSLPVQAGAGAGAGAAVADGGAPPGSVSDSAAPVKAKWATECLCGFTHACGKEKKCRSKKGGLCEQCRVGTREKWDVDCIEDSDIMSVRQMMEMFHPTGRRMPRRKAAMAEKMRQAGDMDVD